VLASRPEALPQRLVVQANAAVLGGCATTGCDPMIAAIPIALTRITATAAAPIKGWNAIGWRPAHVRGIGHAALLWTISIVL
jgi:hypothetical protein